MLKRMDPDNTEALRAFLEGRMADSDPAILAQTAAILDAVRREGDKALFAYTKQFDQVELNSLQASEEEIDAACARADASLIADLQEAAANITAYHEQQKYQGYHMEKEDGVYLGQRVLPLARVGVYVPGGRAAYPSTVLMNVLPAKIAGVKEIIMVTPPDREGTIPPVIAAAAKVAGVTAIYKVGGGQTFRSVFGKPRINALPLAVFIVVKLPFAADFKTAKSLRRIVWRRTVRHKRHMRIYPFFEFKQKLTFGPSDVAAPEVVATNIGAALLKLHIAVVGIVGFKLARQSLKFTVFIDAPAIVFNTAA